MITLYNTFTKKKEIFTPLHKNKISLYSCGPTVYGKIHIGNIRTNLMTDTLRRVLEYHNYTVRHIKNITDVGHLTRDELSQGDTGEDKIEQQALKEHTTPEKIARFYESYFHETEKKMNILPAHSFPRATQHIPQMISLIETLIKKGNAYVANNNVFLDVTSYDNYGKLSGNTLEALKVGARLEEHPDKRHPWDFALWLKAPKNHLMQWDSPWGRGYPGWHIECSAMSMHYLGETIDIHTGGEDNIFPHHEAEIIQSECVTEKKFVHYWIHCRHLLFHGKKMSKSKGTLFTLEDIEEKGYTPQHLRLALLSSHYRSQMDFSWESLQTAKKNFQKIQETLFRLKKVTEEDPPSSEKSFSTITVSFFETFLSTLDNDLNTPQALSQLYDFLTSINASLDKHEISHQESQKILTLWNSINALLGLSLELNQKQEELSSSLKELLKEREEAKKAKDYTQADAIREKIELQGYTLRDTASGQEIQKKQ